MSAGQPPGTGGPDRPERDNELAVLAANALFYAAFSRRDLPAMEALWARAEPVTCIHPGWNALIGRDEVLQSWRAILGNPASPSVEASGESAHVAGEVAWVLCTESAPDGEVQLVATNVFRREDDGQWRLCHHQAGMLARATPQAARTLN